MKKYYEISLTEDNGSLWHRLLAYILPKSNYFEFGGGVYFQVEQGINTNNKKIISQNIIDIYNEVKEQLIDFELVDNLEYFYTSSINYTYKYDWEWILTRLKLDQKLKQFISSIPLFFDLNFIEKNNTILEINDPAFYHEDTVLMFTIHTEMSAFILLNEKEKREFEQQGIAFKTNIEKTAVTQPKNKVEYAKNNL